MKTLRTSTHSTTNTKKKSASQKSVLQKKTSNNDGTTLHNAVNEDTKDRSKRLQAILNALRRNYPEPRIALTYSSPFELLIATMLSAQCTDERVNQVTATLFQKYHSPADYIAVKQEELERDIYSTGFYKAKAKNIQACCKKLLEEFAGEVPRTLEELTRLAGVGRKTANVILSHCFNTPGVVVDTHVTRLVNRLGLCEGTDAVALEFALMELMPPSEWRDFTHLMIAHGRAVCTARTQPRCAECAVAELCPRLY